jgi:hypothetical protein
MLIPSTMRSLTLYAPLSLTSRQSILRGDALPGLGKGQHERPLRPCGWSALLMCGCSPPAY